MYVVGKRDSISYKGFLISLYGRNYCYTSVHMLITLFLLLVISTKMLTFYDQFRFATKTFLMAILEIFHAEFYLIFYKVLKIDLIFWLQHLKICLYIQIYICTFYICTYIHHLTCSPHGFY